MIRKSEVRLNREIAEVAQQEQGTRRGKTQSSSLLFFLCFFFAGGAIGYSMLDGAQKSKSLFRHEVDRFETPLVISC